MLGEACARASRAPASATHAAASRQAQTRDVDEALSVGMGGNLPGIRAADGADLRRRVHSGKR